MSEELQPNLFTMTDGDGNEILVRELDNLFYNGVEYVILGVVPQEENTAEPDVIDCFVVQVRPFTDENGEEMEELIPIEDEKLEAKLIEIASAKLDEDAEEEEI
ncbi:MAG: DUF1292 domain-containing protein [Clostridia bacterium]|nr:DUF1292 domain-containing protein [Clostridia bacterium]